VCALGGLLITVYVDLPPGGVIVLATIAVYILALLTRTILGSRSRVGTAPAEPDAETRARQERSVESAHEVAAARADSGWQR
ncbi:MAG: hypothetical protein ACTH9F_10660, partial [Brachybacterium tyrofermentans]